MPRPFRLLISARDPGAANNLAPIARLAQASSTLTLHLVAAEPAARIFAEHGLEPEKISAPDDTLPALAARLLEQHQPDAVLVGLSGPGRGIDEALLAAARGRVPSWALQDFWGDVNNGFGAYADTYLVRDDTAARITRTRAPVNTLVSGLPGNASPPLAWQQQRMARKLRQRHHVAHRFGNSPATRKPCATCCWRYLPPACWCACTQEKLPQTVTGCVNCCARIRQSPGRSATINLSHCCLLPSW